MTVTDPTFPARLDPAGCNCTDCATGVSKPLDRATENEIERAMFAHLNDGDTFDATGVNWRRVREQMHAAAIRARDAAVAEYSPTSTKDTT